MIVNKRYYDILTGDARESFIKWFEYYSEEHHHDEWLNHDLYLDEVYLPDTLMYTLIIKWLDTVGIYINVNLISVSNINSKRCCKYSYGFVFIDKDPFESESIFITREEVTKQAIEEANRIYNER